MNIIENTHAVNKALDLANSGHFENSEQNAIQLKDILEPLKILLPNHPCMFGSYSNKTLVTLRKPRTL